MNVIELNIDFSIKNNDSNIEDIICDSYKENEQDNSIYKRRIRKEWGNQAKQIQTLNHCKYLIAYESYSDRKYFVFRNQEVTCINGKGQFRCIIISSEDHKDCEQNITLVIKRIQEILKNTVNIEINYDSSCKIYICNIEEYDIVSSKFYLKAKLDKINLWHKNKNKIMFIVGLLTISIFLTIICWGQITEYASSLILAHEESSKAIISAKISILVNLFTGLYGTVLIETILLIYEAITSKNKIAFDIDYDITKSNVEEYNRKGLMHTIGDGLEQGLDITSNI